MGHGPGLSNGPRLCTIVMMMMCFSSVMNFSASRIFQCVSESAVALSM